MVTWLPQHRVHGVNAVWAGVRWIGGTDKWLRSRGAIQKFDLSLRSVSREPFHRDSNGQICILERALSSRVDGWRRPAWKPQRQSKQAMMLCEPGKPWWDGKRAHWSSTYCNDFIAFLIASLYVCLPPNPPESKYLHYASLNRSPVPNTE